MTIVTHGADPEALQRLAEDMLNHAEYTLGVGVRTQRDLVALQWSGPDADRARQHWETMELPRVRTVSKALAEAAGAVLEHARQQREVSEKTTGAAAPSGSAVSEPTADAGVPPSSSRDLGALMVRAKSIGDALATWPELAQVAAVVATGGRGALAMTKDQYALVSSLIGASKPIVGGTLRAAGQIGNVLNVYDAGRGLIEGDAVQATSGIGGLAAGAVGGPAGGAAWGAGWFVGSQFYERTQGTTYGDALEARNEMAFDTMGAMGMLIVPGNLALAAWDVVTDGGETPDPPDGGGGGR